MVNSHKDLIVWQKSMRLVLLIYQLTRTFPKDEIFGLVSQMRRAAVSIPSNISEGRNRGTRKDFRQFLLIAYGSSNELETQLEIAQNLGYGEKQNLEQAQQLLIEILKMLSSMINKLKGLPLKLEPSS